MGPETFFHSHRNVQMSVRWVYMHMIEEYARHNGRAGLLRERIDGATGLWQPVKTTRRPEQADLLPRVPAAPSRFLAQPR